MLSSLIVLIICNRFRRAPLQALSLVNSKCYHATVPFIYRKLTIQISTPETLQRVVAELVDHPLRQNCLTYARQLNVKGKMLRSGTSLKDEHNLLAQVKLDAEELEISQSDICSAEELEPPYDHLGFHSDRDELRNTETQNSNALEVWVPLATLIAKLQHLVELNYACVNQFSSSLLEALHRYHPSCRLNLNTFRFHSLINPEMDPHELELIRSPCLHGLTTRYVVRDADGYDDYNLEAVMETATIAPNLKELKVQFCFPLETRANHGRRFFPLPSSWKGFTPPPFPAEKPRRRGNLTCISLLRSTGKFGKTLPEWSRVTDISKLRSLGIGYFYRPSRLTEVTEMGAFKSLEKLAIGFDMPLETEDVRQAIENFFKSLSPLKTLRLQGLMDTALVQTILEKHGPFLQELLLRPRPVGFRYDIESMILDPTNIFTFAKSCPLVRELHLVIKRSKGDSHETACYRALGEFPSLEKLALELDCSMPFPRPSSVEMMDQPLDEFDKQVYCCTGGHNILNVHLREAFINAAVDEKLARSIWDVVTSSQPPNVRLSSLQIYPYRGGISGFDDIPDQIFRQLSLCLMVTRGGWQRASDPIDVAEIGRRSRERNDRLFKLESLREKKIMRRIWPPKAEPPDWRRDWSSWPLTLPS